MTQFSEVVAVLLTAVLTSLLSPSAGQSAGAEGIGPASAQWAREIRGDTDAWERFKRIRQGKDPDGVDRDKGTSPAKPAARPSVKPVAAPPASAQPLATSRSLTTPKDKPEQVKAASAGSNSAPAPVKDTRFAMRASAAPVTGSPEAIAEGDWWAFYSGTLAIADKPFYGPYGVDFKWAYAIRKPLPSNPRIVVSMHAAGEGKGAVRPFGPSSLGDIEVRNQDAETYDQTVREWWTFAPNATPAPGRRIAATLHYLQQHYEFEPNSKGLVLEGASLGGAGTVTQTMILPDPWRARIAWVSARGGVIMPRQVYAKHPQHYGNFPPDSPAKQWLWDRVDFAVQAAVDPVVRGIHYRYAFASNNPFSNGHAGSTPLAFVNLVEQHKLGGAFSWTQSGQRVSEAGVNIPELWRFEVPEQDVTLDKAHPALTKSTGNYPLSPEDRVNETKFPRGHYNLGIVWDHARIQDDAKKIVFPLKYIHSTGFGKGVPDQSRRITVNVTPRRPRNFSFNDGDILRWSWDNGVLAGTARVVGDTVTIEGVPLVSGQPYKNLRIFH